MKTEGQYLKQSCLCGKRTSRKTVHKTRVKLGLEPRSTTAFKRKDVGIDLDNLEFKHYTKKDTHFECGKRRPVMGGYRKNGQDFTLKEVGA